MKRLLAALASAAALFAPGAQAHEVADTTVCPNRGRVMLCLHNHVRAHHGLPRLSWQNPDATRSVLYDAARLKRDAIARCGIFSHDPCGLGAFAYFDQVGYPPNTWRGENLAVGYHGERATFRAWLESPGHRANILNANFREYGSSVGSFPGFPRLWVVNFGARQVAGVTGGAWLVYYRVGHSFPADSPHGFGIVALKRELAYNGFGRGLIYTPRFGSTMRLRVMEFQRARGLTADGVVGPRTAQVLFRRRALAVGAQYRLGDVPCKVKTLESANDPGATGYVDPNDTGLMMISLRWHPEISRAQAFDPRFSVPWGADYLADALAHFGGDIELAIAAYNRGYGGAAEWQRLGKPRDHPAARYVELVLSRTC